MKNSEILTRIESLENEAKSLRKLLSSSKNKTGKITDRIKTFKDACEETGENLRDEKFTKGSKDTIAYEKIKIIAIALNGGWAPDGTTHQLKYYPSFEMFAGFRFNDVDEVYGYNNTPVSSRLNYRTEQLAEYAGTQFECIYEEYLY